MTNPTSAVEVAHLAAFDSPFTGRRIDKTRCGMCGAVLPLPGEYPMMVESEDPHAKLYDCTGDPGSTDMEGKPKLLQTGLRILKPVCWAHVQ